MKAVYGLILASLCTIALGLWWLQKASVEIPQASQEPAPLDGRGSEAWCEQMMAVAGDDWTEPDIRLFAERCLLD